jgi:hypothetical protein
MAALVPPVDATDPERAFVSRRLWGGLALLAATLSRYEAWPIAAAFALLAGVGARGKTLALAAGAGLLALLGPAGWIAWNRHAHGEALHFLGRVAAYRKAVGGVEPGALARLFGDVEAAGVNVEDIAIEHDASRQVGYLTLSVRPDRSEGLALAMRDGGWTVA